MKKTYEKPMLLAESFELVEHIAGGCKVGADAGASYTTSDVCTYDNDGIQLFQSSTPCALDWIEDDDDDSIEKSNMSSWTGLLNDICYNAFIDGIGSAFAS